MCQRRFSYGFNCINFQDMAETAIFYVVFKTKDLGRFLDKTVFSGVIILLILGKYLPMFLIKKLKKREEKRKRKNLRHCGEEFINQMLKFIKYGLVGTLPHPDLVGDLVYTPFVLHGNQNCFSQLILKQFRSTLEHLHRCSV